MRDVCDAPVAVPQQGLGFVGQAPGNAGASAVARAGLQYLMQMSF